MAALHITCPHCEKAIEVDMAVKGLSQRRPGPIARKYPQEVYDLIVDAVDNQSMTFRDAATMLQERGFTSPSGKGEWHNTTVRRLYRQERSRRRLA